MVAACRRYVVLKMLVALIIENYVVALRRDRNSLQPLHADAFVGAWSHFDPHATGRISVAHLAPLIKMLPPPLGLDPHAYKFGWIRVTDASRYAYQLNVRTSTSPSGRVEVGAIATRSAQLPARSVHSVHRSDRCTVIATGWLHRAARVPRQGRVRRRRARPLARAAPLADSRRGQPPHAPQQHVGVRAAAPELGRRPAAPRVAH